MFPILLERFLLSAVHREVLIKMFEWIILIVFIILDLVILFLGGWLLQIIFAFLSFAVSAACLQYQADLPLGWLIPFVLLVLSLLLGLVGVKNNRSD